MIHRMLLSEIALGVILWLAKVGSSLSVLGDGHWDRGHLARKYTVLIS